MHDKSHPLPGLLLVAALVGTVGPLLLTAPSQLFPNHSCPVLAEVGRPCSGPPVLDLLTLGLRTRLYPLPKQEWGSEIWGARLLRSIAMFTKTLTVRTSPAGGI